MLLVDDIDNQEFTCAYQEHVGRTAGEEKEESKETIDLVAEDSKRDSVHFKIA